MSLVVEDGTGIDGANTYISLIDVIAYCNNVGYADFIAASSEDQNSAILRGMRYIESHNFIGFKNQTINSLEWPRDDAIDRNEIEIDPSEIPQKLKDAVCETSSLELSSPGSLQPNETRQGLKREEYGDVKFEYFNSGNMKPKFSVITGLLAGLTKSSGTLMRT